MVTWRVSCFFLNLSSNLRNVEIPVKEEKLQTQMSCFSHTHANIQIYAKGDKLHKPLMTNFHKHRISNSLCKGLQNESQLVLGSKL